MAIPVQSRHCRLKWFVLNYPLRITWLNQSTGYVSNSINPIDGYNGPSYLGTNAIDAPNDCLGHSTFLRDIMFTSNPFDAALCATACTAMTGSAWNQTCSFFNTFLLVKNGISIGMVPCKDADEVNARI